MAQSIVKDVAAAVRTNVSTLLMTAAEQDNNSAQMSLDEDNIFVIEVSSVLRAMSLHSIYWPSPSAHAPGRFFRHRSIVAHHTRVTRSELKGVQPNDSISCGSALLSISPSSTS